MSRIDILIERAQEERQKVGDTSTTNSSDPAQVEYLIGAGVLVRCEDCRKIVDATTAHTLSGGRRICTGCFADFTDTAPGWDGQP